MIRFETINPVGERLARLIQQELGERADVQAVVFIGALGICVRRMANLVKDKHTDPAVICVDATGKYVIPVLSGHVGGANQLAREIARITGGEAVITTQSDNLGLWALDTLAREKGWQQVELSHAAMNHAIATFVNQKPTALVLECHDEGAQWMRETCPSHVTLFSSMEDYQASAIPFELLILVSPRVVNGVEIAHIQYVPRVLHLGVGCQKQAPKSIAKQLLMEVENLGYHSSAISTINSIELKKDEPLLAELTACIPQAKLQIFSAGELSRIDVPNPSEKVFEVTGCYGVAESSALAASNGILLIEKQKGCLDGAYYTFALAAASGEKGHIEIVGAGPGDPDLVSVRGRKFLERADLILYAGSLVPKELTYCAKAGATVRSSADLDLEEQFALMKEFYDQGKLVVRLHTGDPCIYGAIQEQMAFFDKYGMDYHITPGISSFLAAAAELRSQFTIPERCQTIILTRGEGRTPMPDKEKLHLLAKHQSTMCIFLSASIVEQVQQELLEGGYAPETPVAACYKLTWKDQRIFRGQLKDLVQLVKGNKLTLTTMIVVGDAIDNREGLSKLYDGHFTHLFRKGKE